jgi:uncharacterized protein YbjT (DUF2867 family)
MDDPATRNGAEFAASTGRTVLVVGATGRLAGLVVPALARRGVRVRGLVRDARRAEAVRARGAGEIAIGDLRDVDSLRVAARGVDGVFHIGPAFHRDETRLGLNMVAAATAAGVRNFVFSRVIQPGNGLWNHSAKLPVERALYASGMQFTVLQPARFYQNIRRLWKTVVGTGAFGEPFSRKAKIAWVDYRDVVEVAAIALTDDRLGYGGFELCARIADRDDIVAVMREVLGREIEVTEPSFDAWAGGSRLPFDEWQLQRIAEMCAHYDEHGLPGNSLVLSTLLGRAPLSFRRYLEDLVNGEPTELP